MTTRAVERYASKLPDEIDYAIEGLSGKTERGVFILLFDEGEMAFTELQEELGDEGRLHQGTLSNSLKKLKRGGLIRKRILEDRDESPFSSKYSVSAYGERFIYSLFDSLGSVQGPGGRRTGFESFRPMETDLLESTADFSQDLRKQLRQ